MKRRTQHCHFTHSDDQFDASGTSGVACRRGHFVCAYHADVVCGVDVWNDVSSSVGPCPVCEGTCPCVACCSGRGERASSASSHKRLIFTHTLAPSRPPTSSKDPLWLPWREFNDAIFEKVLLGERRPLVLQGCMNGMLDPELWNLPKRVLEKEGLDCPTEALLQVRVQGVSDTDCSSFRVLAELDARTPAWFLRQVLAGGGGASEIYSDEYRSSPQNGRFALYCKDWMFGFFEPRWIEALQSGLPERLRPRNPRDCLGGLHEEALHVLMAYMGTEGTRTPLHVDKAGSIAFNCVVWAENKGAGKEWWLYHPSDAGRVDAFLGERGKLQDDSHWVDLDALTEQGSLEHGVTHFIQREGDLVIVPPLAPHCVLNRGGLTFAVAANIIDVNTATEALEVERSNRRKRVRSVYKVKGAIWGSLESQIRAGVVNPNLLAAAKAVFAEEEVALLNRKNRESVGAAALREARAYRNMVTCDLCHADIFNAHAVAPDATTFCLTGCVEQCGVAKTRVCVPIPLEELRVTLQKATSLPGAK